MRNNKNNIIFNVRNITLNLENIKRHLTEKVKIITLASIIMMLSFVNITLCSSGVFYNPNVSALSYSSNIGIGFTFNPTLSISLSSSDLVIDNLVPGATADSNSINISVTTNMAYGYTLSVNTSSKNLVHNNSNNTFSSIATNSDLSNLTLDNTWGYSTSLDSNSWSNYNGLSSSSSTTLLEKDSSASSSIDFKIGAKAGSIQPSGEYTNTINFTVVSNTIPTTMLDAFIASGAQMYKGYFKMQDMTPTICRSIDTDGEKGMQLIDVRDDKVYWVAKLKDDNCWMTQNLDLDLSSSVALTSETSDIDPDSYGKTIYTAETGYSKDNETNVVSWLPSTIVNVDNGDDTTTPTQRADTIPFTGTSVPNWINNYNNPYSADPGDRYRYTNPSSYSENTYTSLTTCAQNNSNDTIGCQHSHFGNYYNWTAAVATNNTNEYNSGTLGNSVCPKNWDLPANGKYSALMTAQEVLKSGVSYTTGGFNRLRTPPLYFQRFGYVDGGLLINLDNDGRYWSSTAVYRANSYYLYFGSSIIIPNHGNESYRGFSIRCLAR